MGGFDWLAGDLRAAGVQVVEHPGWRQRGHGPFRTARLNVVWHHDASAPGPSPYSAQSQIDRVDAGDGVSGNVWVDTFGVWHLMVGQVAWHAGAVLPGATDNWDSVGIETDHTVGEIWPIPQLWALRVGTRVLLARTGGRLEFHSSICDPPGRKTDPAGLDLATERSLLAKQEAAVTPDEVTAIARAVWMEFVLPERAGIGPASAFGWLSHAAIMATNVPVGTTAVVVGEIAGLKATVAALAAAEAAEAAGAPIDLTAVRRAADEGAAAAVARLLAASLQVTVTPAPPV